MKRSAKDKRLLRSHPRRTDQQLKNYKQSLIDALWQYSDAIFLATYAPVVVPQGGVVLHVVEVYTL